MHQFGGEARGGVEPGDEPPRRSAHPGLLLELTRGGQVGILYRAVVGDVEGPRGHLKERLADGDPVLADQQDVPVVIDGQDRNGTRVARDLARSARPIGALDRVDAEREIAAPVEDP